MTYGRLWGKCILESCNYCGLTGSLKDRLHDKALSHGLRWLIIVYKRFIAAECVAEKSELKAFVHSSTF
jgi:hypothetical protein